MENALNTTMDSAQVTAAVPDISAKVGNEIFQARGGWDVRPNADNSMETHVQVSNAFASHTIQEGQQKPAEQPIGAHESTNDHGVLVVPDLQFSKPHTAQSTPDSDSNSGHKPFVNAHGPINAFVKPGSNLDNFEKSPHSSAGTIDFDSPHTQELIKQFLKAPGFNHKAAETPTQDAATAEANYNAAHHWRSF